MKAALSVRTSCFGLGDKESIQSPAVTVFGSLSGCPTARFARLFILSNMGDDDIWRESLAGRMVHRSLAGIVKDKLGPIAKLDDVP